jgi:hypothetical protein
MLHTEPRARFLREAQSPEPACAKRKAQSSREPKARLYPVLARSAKPRAHQSPEPACAKRRAQSPVLPGSCAKRKAQSPPEPRAGLCEAQSPKPTFCAKRENFHHWGCREPKARQSPKPARARQGPSQSPSQSPPKPARARQSPKPINKYFIFFLSQSPPKPAYAQSPDGQVRAPTGPESPICWPQLEPGMMRKSGLVASLYFYYNSRSSSSV